MNVSLEEKDILAEHTLLLKGYHVSLVLEGICRVYKFISYVVYDAVK